MRRLFNLEVRKYLYGVSLASIPVLVYMGKISVEASPLALLLVMALLNLKEDEVIVK